MEVIVQFETSLIAYSLIIDSQSVAVKVLFEAMRLSGMPAKSNKMEEALPAAAHPAAVRLPVGACFKEDVQRSKKAGLCDPDFTCGKAGRSMFC